MNRYVQVKLAPLIARRAFTLVELLVVIAIIGLVSSIAVVALNNSRASGRDAKRIADLRQIQTVLELYFDAYGLYPSCVGSGGGCYTVPAVANFGTLQAIPEFLAKAPVDPINTNGAYGYYYITRYKKTGDCTYVSTGLDTTYVLAARLETPVGVAGSCPATFSAFGNSTLNYLKGNP